MAFNYQILASDISTVILERAALAVYSEECVTDIDLEYRRKYLIKSKSREKRTYRIIPELRSKVHFARINLMGTFDFPQRLDAIFCRKAFVYFDRQTQLEVIGKLLKKLNPGGYLFTGHSESLLQHGLPIVPIRPTIYQYRP